MINGLAIELQDDKNGSGLQLIKFDFVTWVVGIKLANLVKLLSFTAVIFSLK